MINNSLQNIKKPTTEQQQRRQKTECSRKGSFGVITREKKDHSTACYHKITVSCLHPTHYFVHDSLKSYYHCEECITCSLKYNIMT